MPLKGNIKDFQLEEIIKFIGLGRKTGALEINQGPEAAVFYFKNGNLYFVHRNTKPISVTEKILSSRIITEEDAEKIRSGKVFPPESLNLDEETKNKIATILKDTLLEQAAEVFLWNDAEFVFKNNEKRTGEDWGVYLDAIDFLEKIKKHSETLRKFSEKAKTARAKISFRRDIDDESDIVITGKEWKLIGSLKPGMTVEQVASASGLSIVAAIEIVNSLIEKGLLTFEESESTAHEQEEVPEDEKTAGPEHAEASVEETQEEEELKDKRAGGTAEEAEETFDEENLIDELAAITGSIETGIESNSLAKDELERILKTLEEL